MVVVTVALSAPRSVVSGVAVMVTDGSPSIWVTVVGASTCLTSATRLTRMAPARRSARSCWSSASSFWPSAIDFCSSVSSC